MLNFAQPTFAQPHTGKASSRCEQPLNPRALSSASLDTLTRQCELKINRGTAGDEEYLSYILCQLERQRRT